MLVVPILYVGSSNKVYYGEPASLENAPQQVLLQGVFACRTFRPQNPARSIAPLKWYRSPPACYILRCCPEVRSLLQNRRIAEEIGCLCRSLFRINGTRRQGEQPGTDQPRGILLRLFAIVWTAKTLCQTNLAREQDPEDPIAQQNKELKTYSAEIANSLMSWNFKKEAPSKRLGPQFALRF